MGVDGQTGPPRGRGKEEEPRGREGAASGLGGERRVGSLGCAHSGLSQKRASGRQSCRPARVQVDETEEWPQVLAAERQLGAVCKSSFGGVMRLEPAGGEDQEDGR